MFGCQNFFLHDAHLNQPVCYSHSSFCFFRPSVCFAEYNWQRRADFQYIQFSTFFGRKKCSSATSKSLKIPQKQNLDPRIILDILMDNKLQCIWKYAKYEGKICVITEFSEENTILRHIYGGRIFFATPNTT